MYDKSKIDADAEREANALKKQGKYRTNRRIRQTSDYGKVIFDRLFRD